MATTGRLIKVVNGSIIVLTIWSFFHVSVMLGTVMAEWPISTYAYFLVWCTALPLWSFQKLNHMMIPIGKGFGDIGVRHAFYFIALAAAWLVMCMGAPRADESGFYDNNVMAQIALKYFGYESAFDGFSEFVFSSIGHEVAFYAVNLFPLVILTIGGGMVSVMYKKRLRDNMLEIAEYTKDQ